MAEILITLLPDGTGDFPTLEAALSAIADDLNGGVVPANTDYRIVLNSTFPDIRGGGFLPGEEGVFSTSGFTFGVAKAGLDVKITVIGKLEHPTDPGEAVNCEPTGAVNSLPDFRIGNRKAVLNFAPSVFTISGPDLFPGSVDFHMEELLLVGSGTVFTGILSNFTVEGVLTAGGATLVHGGEGQTVINDLHSLSGAPYDITYDLGDDALAANGTLDEFALIVTRARLGVVKTNKPVRITQSCVQDEGLDRYIETASGFAPTQREAWTKIGSLLDEVRFPFGEGASLGPPMMILRDGGLYRRLLFDPLLDDRSTFGPLAGIQINNNGRRIIGIHKCEFRNIENVPAIHIVGNMGEIAIRENIFRVDRAIKNDSIEFMEGSPVVDEWNNALQLKKNRWLGEDCDGYLFSTNKPEIFCGVPTVSP